MAPKVGKEDLLAIFLEEANDLINSISELLRLWNNDLHNKTFIINIKRDLHTLKGSARMVEIFSLSELAHALESLCDQLEKGIILPDQTIYSLIFKAVDRLNVLCEAIRQKQEIVPATDLIEEIKSHLKDEVKKSAEEKKEEEKKEEEKKQEEKLEEKIEEKIEEKTAEGMPAQHSEYVRIKSGLLEKLNNLSVESSIARVNLTHQIANIATNLNDFKFELKTLQDQIKNFESECLSEDEKERFMLKDLRETSTDLVHMMKSISDIRSNAESIMLHQARVGSELQNRLMDARLVPFDSIVPRLGRIVRQVGEELHKQVEFRVLHVEGEVDRNVLEKLIPALEHILRNAIDHGIEPVEIRKAKGKSEIGHISVSFSRIGSEVVIEVTDDGGGMDVDAIKSKAIRMGLLPADTEASEEEILRLILQPGFSTREEVTLLSGRGVGMDVVNGVVKDLSGNLSITTQKNIGSKIMIRLPFTSSLNRILLFKTVDETFGMLLSSIEGVVWANQDIVNQLMTTHRPTFVHGKKPYYFHYLGHLLGYDSQWFRKSTKKAYPVLLLQIAEYPLALLVDELLYSREVVIKALGPQFKIVDAFSGASILSDATVILILDSFALSMKAKLKESKERQALEPTQSERITLHETPLIMVVDDSITIRSVVKNLLERNHYRVIVAKDGIDALQKITKQTPDLVLLDIEMPRMDGFEFLNTIRQDELLKKIPVIMVTAFPSEKNKKQSQELGVKHFMAKPYQDTDLLQFIEEDLVEKSA